MLRAVFATLILGGLLTPGLRADNDYKFVDQAGDEIILPRDVPVYTRENPGPWKKTLGTHEPRIKTRVRKAGLEAIRVLDVTVPHPMGTENEEEGLIERIYVTDKDGLMIGYYKFSEADKRAEARMLINGNINYFEIFVQCSRHGMWRSNYRIDLSK